MRSLGEELFKLAFLAAIFVMYGLDGDQEKPVDWFFAGGVLLWLIVAVTVIRVRKRARIRAERRWILWCFCLLVITLAWFPVSLQHSYSVCPHGQRWENNQFGIARSSNGGPCRNGARPPGNWRWHVSGSWYFFIPKHY